MGEEEWNGLQGTSTKANSRMAIDQDAVSCIMLVAVSKLETGSRTSSKARDPSNSQMEKFTQVHS
jgi:hypothetical protein